MRREGKKGEVLWGGRGDEGLDILGCLEGFWVRIWDIDLTLRNLDCKLFFQVGHRSARTLLLPCPPPTLCVSLAAVVDPLLRSVSSLKVRTTPPSLTLPSPYRAQESFSHQYLTSLPPPNVFFRDRKHLKGASTAHNSSDDELPHQSMEGGRGRKVRSEEKKKVHEVKKRGD